MNFAKNTLVASLITNPWWDFWIRPIMSGLVVAPRATTTALQHSSLKYCVAVIKEEAIAAKEVCEFEINPTKPQTQNCIFGAQIYSFIFQPSVQTVENARKTLKFKTFVPFRAKS